MKKILVSLTAAGALALAGLSMPSPAEAQSDPPRVDPVWLIPAIIAAGVGGIIADGVAAAATLPPYELIYGPAYGPAPAETVYVQPTSPAPECRMMRERVPGGWRRVEVCD